MPLKKFKYNKLLIIVSLFALITGIVLFGKTQKNTVSNKQNTIKEIKGEVVSGRFDTASFKSEAEWKRILTDEEYHILREAGTEVPYTGALNNEKRKGTYYSVGCDTPLFRSDQKYDSGTGWPSFFAPIDENALVLRKESGIGDDRIEVLDTCGSHLGHVFDDGPQPTGKRYCMNSIALRFVPDGE